MAKEHHKKFSRILFKTNVPDSTAVNDDGSEVTFIIDSNQETIEAIKRRTEHFDDVVIDKFYNPLVVMMRRRLKPADDETLMRMLLHETKIVKIFEIP